MVYGAWQGSFSTQPGAFSISFLGSILDSYFAYYLQPRSQLSFLERKVRMFFFWKVLRPFYFPSPYPVLNNIPILPQICVHLCLLLIFRVASIGSTALLAKLFGEWSLESGWARARSLPLEVTVLLACWGFEALSWPSGNSTSPSTSLTVSPHLSPFPISIVSCTLASFFSFSLFCEPQSPSPREEARRRYFPNASVPRESSETKALLPKVYSTDVHWIWSWKQDWLLEVYQMFWVKY